MTHIVRPHDLLSSSSLNGTHRMAIGNVVFRKSLDKLLGGTVPKKVAVALSGGPDSMLLTWLLLQCQFEIYAITIDHKYRTESSREALAVHERVKNWNLNHIIKSLDYPAGVDPTKLNNFEEVAREKRYEAMAQVCYEKEIPVLFLGHHRDDQLETFIQRLQGNSSIFGLAGTHKVSPLPISRDLSPESTLFNQASQVRILRPFWDYDKQDILETCQLNNIAYVTDPTNKDVSLTRRNYLRHLINDVIPAKNNQSRSPYLLIRKSELIDLHRKCLEFATMLENKAMALSNSLQRNGLIREYPGLGSLWVKLPRQCLDHTNGIVTSRFLYRILHPYSTLKHYHWAYAKLERQLIPRITSFLDQGESGTFKLTMMNLVFEVTNNTLSEYVPIHIYRCPITTKDWPAVQEVLTMGEWKLFDSRFWLRATSNTYRGQLSVILYIHKRHKRLLHGNLDASKSFDTLPAVKSSCGTIIAFPTVGVTSSDHDIDYEWVLKKNRFSYCK